MTWLLSETDATGAFPIKLSIDKNKSFTHSFVIITSPICCKITL